MKLWFEHGLLYVSATVSYQRRRLELNKVLLDTGSAATVFSVDQMLQIGLDYAADDAVHRIRGVGGAEFVFTKQVDCLAVGTLTVEQFEIEVGALDYGFEIDGIVGLDFLMQVGAVIDLSQMEVRLAQKPKEMHL